MKEKEKEKEKENETAKSALHLLFIFRSCKIIRLLYKC